MFPSLDPSIGYPFFAMLGLVLGSFGNVVIWRVPFGESLHGRSHCPRCARTLGASELVPVLSWIIQRGRCRGCGGKISIRYPLVELAAGMLFVLAFALAGFDFPRALVIGIAFWAMLVIAIIDARTQLIPDALTFVLLLCGLALAWMNGYLPLAAPAIGLAFFGAQWALSRGRWVGSGDVFLAGALGLLLGSWEHAVLMLFLSYILGAITALILLATGIVRRGEHIAFGPFLVAGAFGAFVFGEKIMAALLL